MSYDQFFRFIFPEGMFDYFELSDFKEKSDRVEIYFEEKKIHPQEYATDNLESKGFYEQVRMQDYPMRGRSCLLFIKKRRVESTSKCNYSHKNEIHPKIVIIKRKINKDLHTLKIIVYICAY